MIRTLGSLLFYARFLKRFSTMGYQRAARDWVPLKPDFEGQTWLVTGATGGIGRAVTLAANAAGARVLAVARDAGKLAALKEAAVYPKRLLPTEVDLSSIAAVKRLAASRAVLTRPVDVLVNNVGVLLNAHSLTEEGFERSFATNLLAPFVLTERLRADGQLDPDGLVINVSSGGMYGAALSLEPMNCLDPNRYDGMAAYAWHKRAQVALTRWWNQSWLGRPRVEVMHPGWVDTAGVQTALPLFQRSLRPWLRTPEQGADTILWLAAERPQPVADGGIWLDRQLDPEHEFGFTRKSQVSPKDLADYLTELGFGRGD